MPCRRPTPPPPTPSAGPNAVARPPQPNAVAGTEPNADAAAGQPLGATPPPPSNKHRTSKDKSTGGLAVKPGLHHSGLLEKGMAPDSPSYLPRCRLNPTNGLQEHTTHTPLRRRVNNTRQTMRPKGACSAAFDYCIGEDPGLGGVGQPPTRFCSATRRKNMEKIREGGCTSHLPWF